MGLGCFRPGFAALKRACNENHSVSCPLDLLAYPPTLCDRSHKTFTPKRGALFAPLIHWARLPPPLIVRAPARDYEADTGEL